MTVAPAARPTARSRATQDRILGAAEQEFARHGIAGARVDRIATTARTSKERIYAYFHSKEELYDTVAQHQLTLAAEAAPLDPYDLPGYAGALFDYFATHTDRHRFLAWGRLELRAGDDATATDNAAGVDTTGSDAAGQVTTRAGGSLDRGAPGTSPTPDPYRDSMTAKVDKLRRAQQAGDLDPTWDPVDVLALVSQIAFTSTAQPELADLARRVADDTSTNARRAAVVRAVATLFPPTP